MTKATTNKRLARMPAGGPTGRQAAGAREPGLAADKDAQDPRACAAVQLVKELEIDLDRIQAEKEINCEDVDILIQFYVVGDLKPLQWLMKLISDHLATCRGCYTLYRVERLVQPLADAVVGN